MNNASRPTGKSERLTSEFKMHIFYRPPFHTPIRPLAWADLVAAEPLLATLASIIARMDAPTVMPDYWRAWSTIKHTMEQLVGWEAVNASLRTEAAFSVAHDYLLQLFERRAAEVCESHGGDDAAAG
jgi:hypothetical protein